jgi:hypothetical protein
MWCNEVKMLELEAFLLTGVSLTKGRAAVVRTGVVGGFMVEMCRGERGENAMRHVLL